MVRTVKDRISGVEKNYFGTKNVPDTTGLGFKKQDDRPERPKFS
jgi:hypothetical protein